MIRFLCHHCVQYVEVADALAGKPVVCAHCGHELTVPSGEFRLEPIPLEEEEATGPASLDTYELAGDEPPPAVLEGTDLAGNLPVDAPAEAGGIPEEFLADRAPLAIDDAAEGGQEEGPIELAPDPNQRERS